MPKAPRPKAVKRVEASDGAALKNRQIIEAMFSQLGASRTSAAVDRAQEMMFDAWDSDAPKRRVTLAYRALAVSPDCADAWVLLAQETTDSPEEAAVLYTRGVAAGERALGKAAFKEDVGMFWGLIETRPYMRALHGLALSKWASGRPDESVVHAREMLRLNPNDNQGIRYLLLNWLLQLGRDAEVASLMKQYKNDGGTEWLWSAALAAFRAKGDGPVSRAALARAVGANGHVGAFLTGRKKLPRRLPPYVVVGSADEAASYAEEAVETWSGTRDAVAWLANQLAPAPPARRRTGRMPPA